MTTTLPGYAVAGTQISYTASKYSSDDYSLQLALNNGVDDPDIVDGTPADNGSFALSFSAPETAGAYGWQEIYTKTEDGTKYVGCSGTIIIRPSLATKANPTFAAEMVVLLRNVLKLFAKTDKASVSFNGQSFNRANMKDYEDMLNNYEGKLQAENAANSGGSVGGPVAPVFIHNCGFPIY